MNTTIMQPASRTHARLSSLRDPSPDSPHSSQDHISSEVLAWTVLPSEPQVKLLFPAPMKLCFLHAIVHTRPHVACYVTPLACYL